jgi:hypothetical protein
LPQDGLGVLAGGDHDEAIAASQAFGQETTGVPGQQRIVPAV